VASDTPTECNGFKGTPLGFVACIRLTYRAGIRFTPPHFGIPTGKAVVVNSSMTSAPRLSCQSFSLEELVPHSTAASVVAARELLLEYGRFVQAQPGVASFCYGSLEREAARLPESYWEQGGGAMVAWLGEFPAGFLAWRSVPRLGDAWELKRLWTRPEARGAGLGRALVEAVEERARAAGKGRLVLDTAPEAMPAAYRLYLAMGYAPGPPYNGAAIEGIVYLGKRLEIF